MKPRPASMPQSRPTSWTFSRELVNQYQMSALVITHEMGIVLHYCQRVIVLFEGEIVEEGPVSDVFAQPRHPYTQKLLSSSLEKVQFEMPEAPTYASL